MRAGASAGEESRRQQLLAEAHERAAVEARGLSQRMAIAERTEAQTARLLAPLAALGHVLLAHRRWPGTRSKNVDLVVVGPGGLLIVDTKCWADVSISDGRIRRGQADVTDDLDGLLRLVEIAQDELADVKVWRLLKSYPWWCCPVNVASANDSDASRSSVTTTCWPTSCGRGQRLTEGQLDAVLARTLSVFPSMNAPVNEIAAVVPEPVLPTPRAVTADDLVLLSEDSVREATLQAALAQPIEEWMTFLHPEQAKLVRRTLSGPARIRGAAGTGKTVVGLHRAAYLAETRPGRILYTSFVKTLPIVLRERYRRLSPQTVDRLEFVHVHKLAKDFLETRGLTSSIDLMASKKAYAAAWARGRQGRRP